MDLGDPISYLVLQEGTPVHTRGGERIGVVEHVLADADADVFDGLVIDGRTGPGGWRFADADQVESIHERGVILTVSEVDQLSQPSENAATMSAGPEDAEPEHLRDKLRRAWDYISGRY